VRVPEEPERKVHPRLARRIVYGAFIVFTTAFVASITVQVPSALYAETDSPALPHAPPRVGHACAQGLRELTQASEAAWLEASQHHDHEQAVRVFEETKRAAWSRHAEIAKACEGDPNGVDALAAVHRFDRAVENAATRHVLFVGRVRQKVESFIKDSE
jgi:hypothetical protein